MALAHDPSRPIGVALLGGGVVGAAVARLLAEHRDELAQRVGCELALVGVAVRDLSKPRPGLDPSLLATDWRELIARPGVDIVVELIGGVDDAAEAVRTALSLGRSVVTANKALIAQQGAALHALAAAHAADLYYEAAVAGAIPLLRPLRESFVGDRITKVLGIVNGTCNYILSSMTNDGSSYEQALARAQELGYAEADPTADVSGADSAAKAVILARLAFHSEVASAGVSVDGIAGVSAADISAARAMGFVVKLLAVAELTDRDEVVVRVHPTLVPDTHPLASVHDAFNAVFINAAAAGEVMFYGRGAGGTPTASAVVGDLVTVGRHLVQGSRGHEVVAHKQLPTSSIGAARTRYYMNLQVADQPGVLAAIAQVFAEHGVSIHVVRQDGAGADSRIVIRTHEALDRDLAATVEALRRSPHVRTVDGVMRVEGER